MGGPIVRTGTNPKFWTGWDKVFGNKNAKTTKTGGKTKSAAKKVTAKKTTAKKAQKSK